MTNVIVRTSTPYNREDLVSFTRTSFEMNYDRMFWGKDKQTVCSDKEGLLSFSDEVLESVKVLSKEKISTKEGYVSLPKRTARESFGFGETYRRNIVDSQIEVFDLNDSAWLRPTVLVKDDFAVIDQDERLPNTVLYDLEIDNGDVLKEDLEKYMSAGTPLNYSEVRPLYAGEYEYKNAVVGIQFSITPAEGRFGIIGSTLNIDIEDTVAKGQAFVSADSGAEIKFVECDPPKRFYTIPQVLTSLVEAREPCSVEITEITRLGFKVALKSNSTGLYVDGTINWLADGY